MTTTAVVATTAPTTGIGKPMAQEKSTTTPTGRLTAAELDEAFVHLARTTGWSFFGARLVLARGHHDVAHRMLRRALTAHRAGNLFHLRQEPHDGLSPADVLDALDNISHNAVHAQQPN